MDLTQLANLGEFIGGVAVLVTLVYLAVQVRQGNSIVRSQVEHETSRRSSELLLTLAEPENRDLGFRAIAAYNELSANDRFSVSLRWLAFLNYYETLYYAHERGEVDDDLWESRIERMKWAFSAVPPQVWDERRLGFGKRFRGFVEAEIRPRAGDPLSLAVAEA